MSMHVYIADVHRVSQDPCQYKGKGNYLIFLLITNCKLLGKQ